MSETSTPPPAPRQTMRERRREVLGWADAYDDSLTFKDLEIFFTIPEVKACETIKICYELPIPDEYPDSMEFSTTFAGIMGPFTALHSDVLRHIEAKVLYEAKKNHFPTSMLAESSAWLAEFVASISTSLRSIKLLLIQGNQTDQPVLFSYRTKAEYYNCDTAGGALGRAGLGWRETITVRSSLDDPPEDQEWSDVSQFLVVVKFRQRRGGVTSESLLGERLLAALGPGGYIRGEWLFRGY
ncbi:uncharacterized protein BDZ99DRAFT_521160 [Mytilinidion resinicola]|uniref:Uncharacterized protein n=1 Tax=Mytilinidion resinicola TaxID=574789 RepID=A0A6A6YM34_9PEZI|nr:uncharacterized protein BDZ99DRAFT_521160 [Mytilinidion resinicola]KAF2809841.1 hypothetical protein BDZ99DRAFT_521160 [Mytilinidion resinicola]